MAVSRRPRWHMDFLRPHVTPTAVWFTTDARPLEHVLAAVLSGIRGAAIPCEGFGSSDCGCQSHLIHFKRMPAMATFRRHLRPPGGRTFLKEIRIVMTADPE